jgi:transcriptional regulator with XRE-family HTH domain
VHTSILNGLGPALRWLRDRRSRKQYQIAGEAGITKGMLSAYETGRQRPSLETLDKILDTLGCDLHDLHNALQIINGQPVLVRPETRSAAWPGPSLALAEGATVDVYGALGISEPLPEPEERALSEMLRGFYRLLRFFHAGTAGAAGAPVATPPGPKPGEGEPEEGGE